MEVKILADENVNYNIVKHIRQHGIDIISILELKRGVSDLEVIKLASKHNAIILTEDSDFGNLAFSYKEKIKSKGDINLPKY